MQPSWPGNGWRPSARSNPPCASSWTRICPFSSSAGSRNPSTCGPGCAQPGTLPASPRRPLHVGAPLVGALFSAAHPVRGEPCRTTPPTTQAGTAALHPLLGERQIPPSAAEIGEGSPGLPSHQSYPLVVSRPKVLEGPSRTTSPAPNPPRRSPPPSRRPRPGPSSNQPSERTQTIPGIQPDQPLQTSPTRSSTCGPGCVVWPRLRAAWDPPPACWPNPDLRRHAASPTHPSSARPRVPSGVGAGFKPASSA